MNPLIAVADLLAPERCLACRRRSPPPWCPACERDVRPLPDGCRRCAAPAGRGHPCWPAGAPIDGTIAVYDYRGPVAAAIVTAKLGGAARGWLPLARALAERVAAAPPEVDVVTWVTTPAKRARPRGGDHARVLATAVARAASLPLARLLDANPDGQDRDRYRARCLLPGSHVLLVDDVITTGATAVRAATTLRQAGAGRVEMAVLARAGSHPLTAGTMPGGDRATPGSLAARP